jgi:hypothetical protein
MFLLHYDNWAVSVLAGIVKSKHVRAHIGKRWNKVNRKKKFWEVSAVQYNPFSREKMLLLVNHSDDKVEVVYNSNPTPLKMPKIGPRPPYYYNPRVEQYYPVI